MAYGYMDDEEDTEYGIPPEPPDNLSPTIPGPPPSKPSLTDGMPKLPNQQRAEEAAKTPIGPPPQKGYEDTARAKFIEQAIREIGYDPITMDPALEASVEANSYRKAAKDPNSPQYEDPLRNRTLRGMGYNLTGGEVGEPVFDTGRREKELTEKKLMGLQQLAFMLDSFDKEMGWQNIPEGGKLVRPGTGEAIENPREFAPKEQRAPTEWELRVMADRGDESAKRILAGKQQEEVDKTKAGVAARSEVTDKDVVKPLLGKLPEIKEKAVAASKRVAQYKMLSDMASKGAGGLVPGLKGILSPILEAMGVDAKIESEAQAYQLMARAGVGKMRLELVGSGQVSNYEQDLMQRVSGGSIKTSREAAKLLFAYYADEAQKTVDDYNGTIDAVAVDYPQVGRTYPKVGGGQAETGGGPPASSLKNGVHTRFANGQTWTLENGKPKRVR